MREFVQYLRRRCSTPRGDDDNDNDGTPPGPKRRRGNEREAVRKKQNTCHICMDRPIDTAFVPCGHVVACSECAPGVRSKCPICRKRIAMVLRTYDA